jgi:hypothetical protein
MSGTYPRAPALGGTRHLKTPIIAGIGLAASLKFHFKNVTFEIMRQ